MAIVAGLVPRAEGRVALRRAAEAARLRGTRLRGTRLRGTRLILIGTRRRTPVGQPILGSNAQKVALAAPYPVLAVKAEE